MEKTETHVVLFLDRDLEKAQFAMKYLASQIAIEPIVLHVFLRNGRDESGLKLDRLTVGKLAEIRQYLQQTQLTFKAIQAVGRMEWEEIAQDTPYETYVNELLQQQQAEGVECPRLVLLENCTCHSPWTLEGERVVTDFLVPEEDQLSRLNPLNRLKPENPLNQLNPENPQSVLNPQNLFVVTKPKNP